jgi:hypothetical protein
MTQHFAHHTPRSTATSWRCMGHSWHLIVGGISVARLIATAEGWLSTNVLQPDNGWGYVDFLTLAQGKACLLRWWARRGSYRAFEHYVSPELRHSLSAPKRDQ